MLQLLDESLEAFLRSAVPLDPTEVAISFDTPDKQWSAGITQPTVNLFLLDIARDPTKARSGVEEVVRNGRTYRRRPPPRVSLSYMLTAWTTDHRDEHQLLGEAMRAVLSVREIPPQFLRPPLDELEPAPGIDLAPGGARSDFWKSIDGVLKPGLELTISLVVDVAALTATVAPPADVQVSTSDPRRAGMRSTREAVADGGRLVTPRGAGIVEIDED